nr:FAD:protein FMN transferase [Frigoribacterium sp. CG_9.8]
MGTMVSLTLPDLPTSADAVAVVESRFRTFDERFSLYQPGFEFSRIAAGQLVLTDSSVELRSMYASALRWRDATDGAFTPHRTDGVIDLNGTVKARAMQAAADALQGSGFHHWCMNAGGDVLIAGGPTTLASVVERWSVDVLTVAWDGSLTATTGLRAAFAQSR